MPTPNAGPTPGELWAEAKGDADRYRALMLEHGLLVALKPGEKAEPLPCGWPGTGAEAALFGHSANTTETTVFGQTQVRIACQMCDLSGTVVSSKNTTAREVAAAIVNEHLRQTEPTR